MQSLRMMEDNISRIKSYPVDIKMAGQLIASLVIAAIPLIIKAFLG
jgi:hypothetical protein